MKDGVRQAKSPNGLRVILQCLTCNKSFPVKPNKKELTRKFCSFECSVVIRRTLPISTCVLCGQAFQPRYADRIKYCSTSCKDMYKAMTRQFKAMSKATEETI